MLKVLSISEGSVFPDIYRVSVNPDEMQHHVEFHLGLHYLPKYPFRGFQYTKGKTVA